MADPKNRLFRVGDWALDMPIPNPGLQAWLNGPEAKAAIEKVTREVYVAYRNALPEDTGNLKRGAKPGVGRRKYPGQSERYYGWVINSALSYRPTKGQPYPRFIEYGKANADGSRTRAGHHLLRAAYEVARRRGASTAQLAALSSQLEENPAHHQARPAKKRPKRQYNNKKLKGEFRGGGATYSDADGIRGGGRVESVDQKRARLRREQEQAANARARAMRERIAKANADKNK